MSLLFFESRKDFFSFEMSLLGHSQDFKNHNYLKGKRTSYTVLIRLCLFHKLRNKMSRLFLIHMKLGLTMLRKKLTGNVCPDMLKTKNKLKTIKSLPTCGQDG